MIRCNKCGRKLDGGPCTYCPDPAQRLMALQARVGPKGRTAPPKRVQGSAWWMNKARQFAATKDRDLPLSGQDAAMPPQDR